MPDIEATSSTSDQVNRLWQHGLHEERLFHDRLNYFSFLETGLLTICVILYNKEPSLGLFLPITAVALVFTILWLMIQWRHWAYCVHVNSRIREIVPEYKVTISGFSAGGYHDGLSISKPLALAVPALFACTWISFIVWLLVRPVSGTASDSIFSFERLLLAVLFIAVIWLIWKVRRLYRLVRARNEVSSGS